MTGPKRSLKQAKKDKHARQLNKLARSLFLQIPTLARNPQLAAEPKGAYPSAVNDALPNTTLDLFEAYKQ